MNQGLLEPASGYLELRHASTERPVFVVVPERRFLVIEGTGQPGAADFRMAATLLRAVHDAVRASLRRDRFADGPRSVLEIAWLTDVQGSPAALVDALAERRPVHWRQMLELPLSSTLATVEAAIQDTRRGGGRAVALVRALTFTEGRAAQVLHLGGMTDLSPTIARLCQFVAEAGREPLGDVHQLVVGDPDVVPPHRARSIIRMPLA